MILSLFDTLTLVSSGEQGIEKISQEHFDLVLLDMIMAPGINGGETYDGILAKRGDQKAIVVSGFAEDQEVHRVL